MSNGPNRLLNLAILTVSVHHVQKYEFFWLVKLVQKGEQLIKEGAGNVDINMETIDGKNTFHYMARAIFQLQE